MRQIQLLNVLRRATICVVFTLFCLSAASQDMIDLSKTPVLCNQTHMFRLKEVLPDGYVYYYIGRAYTGNAITKGRSTATLQSFPNHLT